ncbi:MAG TPA: hypothetical protein V6C65_35760 [Allocoleopsis sp.]
MHYVWWFAISVINVLFGIIANQIGFLPHLSLTAISISNLLLAILIRNELILSLLYHGVILLSKHVSIGRYLINTGIHYIGSVHVACILWSFIWILIDISYQLKHFSNPILITTSLMLIILLLSIILTALPPFREKFHNTFERVHRYIGWLCLAILTLHITVLHLININQTHSIVLMLFDPVFIMVIVIIISVFLPWLTVQRFNRFNTYCPSPGVMVILVPGKAEVGTFARISTDFMEWHSFSVAGIQVNPYTQQSELRLIVAATGDWTRNLIRQVQRENLPECLWIRRVKPPGFMFSVKAYSRVLMIATGAGIAPLLPYVEKGDHKHCILWIGNDHQTTYGDEIWSTMSAHPRLRIYDTGVHGRPNVGELAINTLREFNAQAVFCVSNRSVTKVIVNTCLAIGIPAYGATWDS